MANERLIAELAALREKHTLDEVLELVMVGLGGKEKVAAELDEQAEAYAALNGEAETPDPLTVMRDADVGRLETIQTMAESFCTWLHAKGEAQMKLDTDEAVDKVRQLSTSFNKAARAVRLSMVLKHEVAGLRPLPHVRPAAGAANENGPASGSAARAGDREDRSGERREESDAELTKRKLDNLQNYMRTLSAVLDEDLADAPPEIQAEAKRQSLSVKLTTIAASIPHPKLDRKIADTYLGEMWDSFAPRYATKPEALGPPDPEVVSKRSWNVAPHQRTRGGKAAQRG
jgi:hypothetical protein